MLRSAMGLEIASDVPAVAAIVDSFTDQVMGFGKNAEVIQKAIELDPHCVIANAYGAVRQLLADRLDAGERAQPFLNAARPRLAEASAHERAFFGAVESWASGDADRTIARLEAILDEFPRDLITLSLAQVHHFRRGNSLDLLRVCEKVYSANQDSPYIHGMLSFGYEECGRYAEAEAAGRRGVALNRGELGAQHAVAHVLEMQGRVEDGVVWLEGLCDTWGEANTWTSSHLWWHLAVFRLDMDDHRKALQLFDSHVWGDDSQWGPGKEMTRFPINGIYLLWRLQMSGVDVGDRWRRVAARVTSRTKQPVEAYPALLYLYALKQGGEDRAAAELLESIEARGRQLVGREQRIWLEVALPTARGILAYAEGRFDEASRDLALGRQSNWVDFGHSPVQRDIFARTLLDSIIRLGRWDEASPMLQARAQERSASPGTIRQLAAACEACGDMETARLEHARAAGLERRYRESFAVI